jgi:hypothetical protein
MLAGARALALEARSLGFALREEASAGEAGPIVVTGVLAEQLAKELGAGARPGAVVYGSGPPPSNAEVLVHVLAGDPTAEDEDHVEGAVALGVEVVIVELWPQADWTRPFVLSPFVVECRAGEGFPVREIAGRIVEAAEHPTVLAADVPAIADAARASVVTQSVVRAALVAFFGGRKGSAARPILSLEQVRMVSRLRVVSSGAAVSDELPVLAGGAASVAASGFALRRVARAAREILPDPVADAVVAAAGTWALAKAFGVAQSRLPAPPD